MVEPNSLEMHQAEYTIIKDTLDVDNRLSYTLDLRRRLGIDDGVIITENIITSELINNFWRCYFICSMNFEVIDEYLIRERVRYGLEDRNPRINESLVTQDMIERFRRDEIRIIMFVLREVKLILGNDVPKLFITEYVELRDECSVCLEEKLSFVQLKSNCKHYFCNSCINNWINENKDTCPLCRSKLF